MELSGWTSIAFAGVAVFGAALLGLSLLAVRRARSPRMLLVAGGFLIITLQGLVIGVLLYAGDTPAELLLLYSAAFEAALLVVLFLATLVR